ncbi:MAG: SAM-dependent methyltransferase [Spirochaetaceae bacterium]
MNKPSPWDSRYDTNDYLYGETPNRFIRDSCLGLLHKSPGGSARRIESVIELACGEGRNAVFLAGLGLTVTAVDSSTVGLAKARSLAERSGHVIETIADDALSWTPERAADLVVSSWFHVRPEDKSRLFASLTRVTAPGAYIVCQWFHPDQRRNGLTSGGPPDPEMMFEPEEIAAGLDGLDIVLLSHGREWIDEGPKHKGEASVTSVIARRRETASDV